MKRLVFLLPLVLVGSIVILFLLGVKEIRRGVRLRQEQRQLLDKLHSLHLEQMRLQREVLQPKQVSEKEEQK